MISFKFMSLFTNQYTMCEIGGAHSGADGISRLVRYNAV